jgi:hypothetical protein
MKLGAPILLAALAFCWSTHLLAVDDCPNRSFMTSACLCNGSEYSSGYCCYNKVTDVVHQDTKCGYTEVSPHYESMEMHNHGNIYFTGGCQRKNNPPGTSLVGCSDSYPIKPPGIGLELGEVAKHYDYSFNAVGFAPGADITKINGTKKDYDTLKAINPKIKLYAYEVYNELDCVLESDDFCEKYKYIQKRTADDGVDFEDIFLHFKNPTTLCYAKNTEWEECRDFPACTQNDIDTRNQEDLFKCRVPFGYSEYWRNDSSSSNYPQDWRWRVNSRSLNYQKYNAEWTTMVFNENTSAGLLLDGIMVDNMGRGIPYESNVAELEGSNVWEVTDSDDWFNGMVEVEKAGKKAANDLGKTLNINTSGAEYFNYDFVPGADGFIREWVIRANTANTYAEDKFLTYLVPQTELTASLCKGHYLHFTLETFWDQSGQYTIDKCWENYTMAREQMWSLATYYLVKYPGLSFYPGYKTWSGYWFGAVTVDIGQPIGKWFVWKTGLTDTYSKTFKVYRRNFTKGAVFVRFDEGSEGYCPGASGIAATSDVPLDAEDIGKYRNVDIDGNIGGSTVSSLNMQFSSGVILVKDTEEGTPDLSPFDPVACNVIINPNDPDIPNEPGNTTWLYNISGGCSIGSIKADNNGLLLLTLFALTLIAGLIILKRK